MQSNWASFTDKSDRQPTCFVFHGLKLLKFKGEHEHFSQDLCRCPPTSRSCTPSPGAPLLPMPSLAAILSPLPQHTETHTLSGVFQITLSLTRQFPSSLFLKTTDFLPSSWSWTLPYPNSQSTSHLPMVKTKIASLVSSPCLKKQLFQCRLSVLAASWDHLQTSAEPCSVTGITGPT